jgi:hypothetical protein
MLGLCLYGGIGRHGNFKNCFFVGSTPTKGICGGRLIGKLLVSFARVLSSNLGLRYCVNA